MTQADKKAKELVEMFRDYSHTDFIQNKGGYQMKSQIESAKQCALICVDEMKDEVFINVCENSDCQQERILRLQELEEVEQAINKL